MAWNNNFVRVRSRHKSHDVIRKTIPTGGKKVVFRLGSTTKLPKNWTPDIEINSEQSIKNASNKIEMKRIFAEKEIPSPLFYEVDNEGTIFFNGVPYVPIEEDFPLIAKRSFRSRGKGMKRLNTQKELDAFIAKKVIGKQGKNPYYFEVFANYTREYRLHVSKNGCFYGLRKALRQEYKGTEKAWYRNDSNCVWILETNPMFNKPDSWQQIINDCVKAKDALGLDIGGFDVKVAKDGRYKIIEGNSACSFGEITAEKYTNEIKALIADV